MDIIENNLPNSNGEFFNELKTKYPSLTNVEYIDGNLVFPDGKKVAIRDFSIFPPQIFGMRSANLYIYLSNSFYRHNEENYNREIETIFDFFTQIVITEDEVIVLERFAYDFWLRLQLYSDESVLAQDEEFMKELLARRKVITESYRSASMAATIITDTYNKNLIQTQQNQTNNNAENNQSQVQSQNQSLALVRQKSGVPSTIPTNEFSPENSKLSIAGFASVIIIICATLAAGAYLALSLLK